MVSARSSNFKVGENTKLNSDTNTKSVPATQAGTQNNSKLTLKKKKAKVLPADFIALPRRTSPHFFKLHQKMHHTHSLSVIEQQLPISDEIIHSQTSPFIPCMLLPHLQSTKLLLYLHGNGEDVQVSRRQLMIMRAKMQISILAVEYPRYEAGYVERQEGSTAAG